MTGAPAPTARRERPTWPRSSLRAAPATPEEEVPRDGASRAESGAASGDRELADELLAALRARMVAAREHARLRARQGDEARRRGAAQAVALLAESDACAARAGALARELAALERTWGTPTQGRRP